jgi:membrane protein implicated in regulation of membrane protease activity
MPDLSLGTLNCIYFVLFFVGVGYAVVILISGGLSNIDLPNVDVDIPQVDLPGGTDFPGADIHIGGPDLPAAGLDAPDVQVSPLSPITIASFITSFGGIGVLATQFFGVDPKISLLWATGGAVLISAGMYLFYSQVLIRSQSSTDVHRGELIGLPAEVTTPIGESAAGQVSYVTKAGRMSSIARSVDGQAIGRGQLVTVVRTVGRLVLVRPVQVESAEIEKGE